MLNIFLDLDQTVYKSINRFISIYNKTYDKCAIASKVRKWDLSDQCEFEYVGEIEGIFARGDFYEDIELFEGSIEVINKLKKEHSIKFVSIGTCNNVINKIRATNLLFPDVSQIMLIKNSNMFGKEDIDMRNSILLDDHSANLISSNAEYKILFEPHSYRMEYNESWKGLVVKNWKEFEELVDKIERGEL